MFLKPGESQSKQKRSLPSTTSELSLSQQEINPENKNTKDPLDNDISDSDSYICDSSINHNLKLKERHTNKKIKTCSQSSLLDTEKWKNIESTLNDSDKKYTLNVMQLQNLLDLTKGADNIIHIAMDHTKYVNELIRILTDVHHLLPGKALKNRCIRLKKIQDYLKNETTLEEES